MADGRIPPILDIGGVLISSEIITECFCCDYEKCRGICCVEGDAGAPVTMEEVTAIEDSLDEVWPDLSASAQSVIDRQGVAYADCDGDMVTSIVRGKECVFARSVSPDVAPNDKGSDDSCWLCMLERAYRQGRTRFMKPISCSLYPIRAKTFSDGLVGLNYHRWAVCHDAVVKGREEAIHVYEFLREPLVRRFGQEWYDELCAVVKELGIKRTE